MANKNHIRALIQKQRWQEAQLICSNFCNHNIGDAEGWFLLGAICGQIGAFAESENACIRAIELCPEIAMAHCNLGISLRHQGKMHGAILALQEAIRLAPDLPQAHNELGIVLQSSARLGEAANYYQRAIELDPSYANAYFNLATIMFEEGRFSSAEATLQQVINLNNRCPEAHFLLAQLLRMQRRVEEAICHLRVVVKATPSDAFAWNALAGVIKESLDHNSFSEAEECYRAAIRYQPTVPEFYVNLASLLKSQGRHEECFRLYQTALKLRPSFEAAIGGVAQVLELRGDFEAAYSAIAPLIKQGSDDSTVALAYAAIAPHINQIEEATIILKRIVNLPKPSNELRSLHFCLGKLYGLLNKYHQAFPHYAAAHETNPVTYDSLHNKQKFDDLISAFSVDNLSRMPRSTNRSKVPVFIVGMPRSGTSLIEQILASHPNVYGAGELHDVHGMTLELSAMMGAKIPYPHCVQGVKTAHLDKLANRHLAKLRRLSKMSTRITDKMPHNFLTLGLIELLFPEAHIIHCKRDPIDTCLSIYSLEFDVNHSYARNLKDLGEYYVQYLRLMEHWKSVLTVPLLEVQYEDLVFDQERITRQMLRFCDLPWDDRCLNFHESDRMVFTHSYDQVRQPIYRHSIGRWKNYETFLGPLIQALNTPMLPGEPKCPHVSFP